MALLFMDGFDYKGTTGTSGSYWEEPAGSGYDTGRFGGFCQVVGNQEGMRKWFSAFGPTVGVGFAWNYSVGGAGSQLVSLWDGTSQQVELRWDGSLRQFYFTRNGTEIARGTSTISTAVWNRIELKVLIHGTAGTVDLQVNGGSEIHATGLNTKATSNSTITRVGFVYGSGGSSGNVHEIDDIVIWDGTTSINNDWFGDVRVETLFPTGAGNSTQWTPSTGSNWQNVDETPPNDDTDYNSSATNGDKDTFAMADIGVSSATIIAIQSVLRHRKADAGGRTLRRIIRSSGTDYEGPDVVLSSNYQYAREILLTDPATSAAWTLSGVNALQHGYKVQG